MVNCWLKLSTIFTFDIHSVKKDGYPLLALGKEEVIHFFHQQSDKRV